MGARREVHGEVGENFSAWVRSRRIAEMLTQEELAERCGLSVRTVRDVETGRNCTPRLTTKRLIIAALTAPA
jgi:DNA-binding XRE family transcriptional regulator